MSTEGHTEAMQAAIPRERMHRIADIEPRPACSGGSCKQGRARCETPEACITPVDDDEMTDTSKALVIAASLAVALIALGAAVLPMLFN